MPPVNAPVTALPAPACAFGPPDESRAFAAERAEAARQWIETELPKHEPALRAFLRMKFPQIEDQEDLLHETYLRVIRACATGRIELTKAFFYTVARNLGYDYCRRKALVPMEPLEEAGESAVVTFEQNAADHAVLENDLAVLSAAITALPERAREVIVLRKLKGLSLREISAQLGISEKTCMAHINVALAKVRTFLAEHGVTKS